MGKTKPFVDRKKAVTFHLVHRSQHDPLVADEKAPQHVLLEAKSTKPEDPNKRKEEQKKFGVFFDDDYDYLQHLKQRRNDVVWEYVETPNSNKKKDSKEKPEIKLPSSVFATEFEEHEGLLNKAALRPGPRPDWDPDVVAALDDDFDFQNPDNELEDDFILKAMESNDGEESDEDYDDEDSDVNSNDAACSDYDEDDDEVLDRLGPLMRERDFNDEETKSRFTEYSMSSSVIRRNEQLVLLDDRFEKFYSSYDDPEVGPLDLENIEGYIDSKDPLLLDCYKEYQKSTEYEEYNKKWDKDRIKRYVEKEESDEELVAMEVDNEKKKKWDCESVLSTYSNLYNHPKLIEEPRRNKKISIDPKTGMPINVLRGTEGDKLTTKTLAKFDNENSPAAKSGGPKSLCDKSVLSTLSVLSIRPKDESLEEKRERKRLLKEYRAERRMEKKANANAFKEEKKRQEKIKINNQNNNQGNKIV